MASDLIPPNWTIQDILIRMMTPMRREFSRNLDVQYFLRDGHYAETMLAIAETSADARMQSYAQRIKELRSAKDAHDAITAPSPMPPTGASSEAADTKRVKPDAVDGMLNKYTRGLR